jgi:hypothetical protein
MTALAPRLRAMDLCDLLDRAVAHYRENCITLLGIYAVGYAPFWLLVGLAAHFLSGTLLRLFAFGTPNGFDEAAPDLAFVGTVGLVLVFTAAVFFVEPIVAGATARAVSEQILGRKTNIRAAYAAVRRRAAALLFSSFIRLVAVYGAHNIASFLAVLASAAFSAARAETAGVIVLVLLQLGALLVASVIFIYLAFLGQIIVIENRGTAEALTRSWRLVSGHLWRTSAIAGLLVLLVSALTIALQLPLLTALLVWWPWDAAPESFAVASVLTVTILAVTSLLASPVLSVGATLMYYDLRVRREGFDVELMAASLAADEAPPS